MRFPPLLLALVVVCITLAIAGTHAQDAPTSTLPPPRRPWQRSHKSHIDHHRRRRHAEPDYSKPHRPFGGGHVHHPMFEGSGCPNDSVVLVNASDTSSFALSALFSQFQAQTSSQTLRDRRTCIITVALEPEENMSIGVAHVDFRGSAYVPVGTSSAVGAGEVTDPSPHMQPQARLRAAYSLTGGDRDRIANTTYTAGYDDQFYEAFDVSDIAWTPCEGHGRGSGGRVRNKSRVFEFRIFATIIASKASAGDEDVAIAVDTSDSTLQKGVYYELTTRPCATTSP